MKLFIFTFFVIIAADVARSQGVRRERPPGLPKTSTKKGQRPSGRPIRVRNFGPPPPPRPQGGRDYYDFNFYHRRKDPIIPVELHPPILQRPKPKDSFRERPRSRSADRPKRRRTTTTAEPTPPTTYYDLTTFPITSTTLSIAPPTKPPVKTTTKQTPTNPKLQVKPKTTTTKASVEKSNVGNQKVADKPVSISNNSQTHRGHIQEYGVIDTQAPVAGNINSVQTSNSVSNKRVYAQTFFGANKIPRPPPLSPQAYGPEVRTETKFAKKSESTINQISQGFHKQRTFGQKSVSYKLKPIPQSNSIFETQRTSNSKFRRPSDIPVELKPNIISRLTTDTVTQPPPSNPEKYASGQNTLVKSNIETNQVRKIYSKQETHLSPNIKNKQVKATYERVTSGHELQPNSNTKMKQDISPKNAQIEQSVLTSKYSPQISHQGKFANEASSFSSSTDPRPVSTGVLSQTKTQSRNVSPEVASAFIENRVPSLPQRSSLGKRGSIVGEWQKQQLLPKPFRSNPVVKKNNPPVTGGSFFDQASVSDGKLRSFGSINNPGSFVSPRTNSVSINPALKSRYSIENRPLDNSSKTQNSSSQTDGEIAQFQQVNNRPLSGASQNKVPYDDSIKPTASKFNTMNMKSGVIPSVRRNFNGNAETSGSQKTPYEQTSKMQGNQQVKQWIASPILHSATQRRNDIKGHRTSKPLQNVGLLGPKLPLDRSGAVLNPRVIGETRKTSNSMGSNDQTNMPVQQPITTRRFKDKSFRSVGSSGPSVGTLFDPSAESASYSLGLDQTYRKEAGTNINPSQAEQLANINFNRTNRKTTEISPKESSAEPYFSRSKQTGNVGPKVGNQPKQLPGIEQQPEWASSQSRQEVISADFIAGSRLIAENPKTSRRQQFLVKPTVLPDGNTYPHSTDHFYSESSFNDQPRKQFMNSPVGDIGFSTVKSVSPKSKNTGFSSQSKHLSNRNPSRPLNNTRKNSPTGSSAVITEPYLPRLEQVGNVSPTIGNQHKQLPAMEQHPGWASSRSSHGEMSADFNDGSHLTADVPIRKNSLVNPTTLPDRNTFSHFNDKFLSGGSFHGQQRLQFINSPESEVDPSSVKEVSQKVNKMGFSRSGGSNNRQNLGNNAVSRSEHSRGTGQLKRSGKEGITANYDNLDTQVKQQQSGTISYPQVEQRKPSHKRNMSRKGERAFNSGTVQSKNEVTRKSKSGKEEVQQHSSGKHIRIAKQRKAGQNKDESSNGTEIISKSNGRLNNAQNNKHADQSNEGLQSESSSVSMPNIKAPGKSIKASTTVKSKQMKMSKSASERVRKVGSLMLEAFNDFLSKINGGKALSVPNTNGKNTPKQSTSPSVDKNKPNEPVGVKSKMSVSIGRTSAVDNKRASTLESKTRELKSTNSFEKVGNKPGSKSSIHEGVIRNSNGERQSTQHFKPAANQGSKKHSISKTTAKNTSKITNNEGEANQRSEGVINSATNDLATDKSRRVKGKNSRPQHIGKGIMIKLVNRRISNEITKNSNSSANNSSIGSRKTTTNKSAPKRGNDNSYRFESEVISGPPPSSFRKNKNKSLRPRTHKKRNNAKQKGIRNNENAGRIGSKKSGSQNNLEKEPPGYNVPAGAHPPVLTRSVSKGSAQGGSSGSANSAEKTSKQSAQGGGGKPGQGPCSLSPVCGSDGFTYMSSCFLWEGLTVACDGYCPCPSEPSQPVLKQTSQTGVAREPIPSPLCNCPAKYSPVCSTSGRTFENDCARACNGEEIACDGECPCPTTYPKKRKPCESYCSATFRPVCSVWGYSYENDCLRHCSGEAKACDGECPCPYNQNVAMDPVGSQYDPQNVNNEPSNQPLSTCECRPGDIDPVCTTSGETLWYGCEAICLGYTIACSSECPC